MNSIKNEIFNYYKKLTKNLVTPFYCVIHLVELTYALVWGNIRNPEKDIKYFWYRFQTVVNNALEFMFEALKVGKGSKP